MRRQNALWISGTRVLRFPAIALRTDRIEVAEQVIAALVAGGWVPTAGTRTQLARLRSS
jgi:hypothetical protein